MLERELRSPVEAWLEDRHYWVIHEILIGGYCDLYGVCFQPREGRRIPKPQTTAAVELKLEDFGGALHQACLYSHYANYTYIAMPARRFSKMRDKTADRAIGEGIGLLAVGEDSVDVFRYERVERHICTQFGTDASELLNVEENLFRACRLWCLDLVRCPVEWREPRVRKESN
jgi:hypothetical protein